MLDNFLGCDTWYYVRGPEGINDYIILFQLSPVYLQVCRISKRERGGVASITFMSSSSCVTLHILVSRGSNM